MPASRRWLIWWAVALFLLSIIIYLPPYDRAFVGDDYLHLGYVVEFLQQPAAVLNVFKPLWTAWYYRPLQNVWTLICRLLFGLNPFGYYYLQTLWHLLAAAALVALTKKLFRNSTASAVALALFLIHSHHHDVVAWISSISVIMSTAFSLLAVVVYVNYVQDQSRASKLLAVALLALFAMLSHEEGVLLPLFLLAARLLFRRRRRVDWREAIFFLLLFILALGLGAIHFSRPNSTIALYEQSGDQWLAALDPQNIAGFILAVGARWLLLNKSVAGVTIYGAVTGNLPLTIVLASVIAAALIIAFWRGGKILRLAIVWIALHLAFLYLAVWLQKPELFAGRHLYSSWAFVTLVVAHSGLKRLSPKEPSHGDDSYRLRIPCSRSTRCRLLLSLLALLLAANVAFIGDDQRAWQDHVNRVASVETQMKQIIPTVSQDTQIFAHRFVLLPGFTPYAAAVWYAEPGLTGGSLDKMRAQAWLTGETYLLDYDGELLFNLLPDLQDHRRTAILWQAPHAAVTGQTASDQSAAYTLQQVAGPPGARRLAVRLSPPAAGWLALTYDVDPPPGAQLGTAILGEAGTVFRVRFVMEDGTEIIAATVTVTSAAAGAWHALSIPLGGQGQIPRQIVLEVSGPPSPAYWSTPRLTLE